MIRKATKMFVYANCYDEYEKRHSELWQEMKTMLKEHGAQNYSIFLDKKTGDLFSYVEIESEKLWGEVAETEICRKWWGYMEPLMKTNEDSSPVTEELVSVFFLK